MKEHSVGCTFKFAILFRWNPLLFNYNAAILLSTRNLFAMRATECVIERKRERERGREWCLCMLTLCLHLETSAFNCLPCCQFTVCVLLLSRNCVTVNFHLYHRIYTNRQRTCLKHFKPLSIRFTEHSTNTKSKRIPNRIFHNT